MPFLIRTQILNADPATQMEVDRIRILANSIMVALKSVASALPHSSFD
jgi:hypothetical protein